MEYNPTQAIMANLPPPSATARDGSKNVTKRITKSGRVLWYEMNLIQEPERARACGSGPKSSADRRPVDPPPVIQFRVYEGEEFKSARDITFDYNADFFVYASLEQARPIAHGRMQAQPPVLTGFPVSGCCYLDRPSPAGYFIFPDLSVRHEGLYKLVFTLYEQTKEDRDGEANSADEKDKAIVNEEGQGFYHRMDVYSSDFTVFSAKKFPGLAESTNLSRTVAEQGCRVRIRRDVRMRRRDQKSGTSGGHDKNAEEDFSRQPRTQTPDIRARSSSNSSMDRTPYGPDAQRRLSNVDYRGPGGPGGPLDFAGRGGNAAGFVPPPSTYAPHAAHRASPAPSYSSTTHTSPYPLPSPTGSTGYPATYGERPMSRHEMDSKRPSSISHYAPIAPATKVSIPHSTPGTPASLRSRKDGSSDGPLAALEIIAKNAALTQASRAEPLAPSAAKQVYAMPALGPIKRSREEAFPRQPEDRRLANGQRPEVEDSSYDEALVDEAKRMYARADGSTWLDLGNGLGHTVKIIDGYS